MVNIICTIWALMLHTSGIYVFQTCCVNTTDDDGESFIFIPPLPAFFFATGVYVIVAQISLLPQSFQRPVASVLCIYELISTLFILEFSVACIWSPINVLILSTLPKAISHVLNEIDEQEAANWIDANHPILMMAMIFIVSVGFLMVALHITHALDFTIFTNYGIIVFIDCAITRLWQRLVREFPSSGNNLTNCCDPRTRRRPPRRRKPPFRECDCHDEVQ